jgi:hypothetical protein
VSRATGNYNGELGAMAKSYRKRFEFVDAIAYELV